MSIVSSIIMSSIANTKDRLLEALRDQGHPAVFITDNVDRVQIEFDDKVQVRCYIERDKVSLVGDHSVSRPSRKTWHETKNGLNLRGIASGAILFAQDKREANLRRLQADAWSAKARSVEKKLGLRNQDDITIGCRIDTLTLNIECHASEAQIRAMVECARSCGLIPPKGAKRNR